MARILLVDDDRFLLELWERVLTRQGHEVFVHDDGDRGRDALTEPDAAYDLLLAGLRLAGTGGLDLLRTARLLFPDLPVVLLAAAWLEEERRAAERAGAARLLNKPIDPAILVDVLGELLPPAGERGACARPADPGAERAALGEPACPPAPSPDRAAEGDALERARPATPPAAAPAPAAAPRLAPAPAPAPAPAEPRWEPAEIGIVPLSPPLILLVEKDPCARRLLGYCLERQGFRTADAQGRAEGLELAEMDTPDALVFGDGDDGLPLEEALRRVRADPSLRGLPVVVVYDNGATAEAVSALDQGADVAIERPYEPDLLFAHLRAALRRAAAARAAASQAAQAALAATARPAVPAPAPAPAPQAGPAARAGGGAARPGSALGLTFEGVAGLPPCGSAPAPDRRAAGHERRRPSPPRSGPALA